MDVGKDTKKSGMIQSGCGSNITPITGCSWSDRLGMASEMGDPAVPWCKGLYSDGEGQASDLHVIVPQASMCTH